MIWGSLRLRREPRMWTRAGTPRIWTAKKRQVSNKKRELGVYWAGEIEALVTHDLRPRNCGFPNQELRLEEELSNGGQVGETSSFPRQAATWGTDSFSKLFWGPVQSFSQLGFQLLLRLLGRNSQDDEEGWRQKSSECAVEPHCGGSCAVRVWASLCSGNIFV